MQTIANLWEPYGLRGSPFFQEELRPGDHQHPVELFVGRRSELGRLMRRVGSDSSSRSIVEGDPGIGKTSFINRLKSELSRHGVATYEHPIRIHSGTTTATFVADTLRLLLRIRLAAGATTDSDRFWMRTARLLEGGEIRGGSLSAFGVGGGISRGYVAPELAMDSLYEHLGEALRRMQSKATQGVLIHVNNLENLSEEAAGEAAGLIRDLRDHLMLPGAHWIFGGATGIDRIFRSFAQVDGIFPAAETLTPLGSLEIEEILERRYRHLALPHQTVTPPVEPPVAARLYDLYQGDLRNFLRLLADAAERGLGLAGVKSMRADDIVRHTAPGYADHLRQRTGEGDFEHLKKILLSTALPHEFRVTDAAKLLGIKQSSASQLVERLQKSRVIRRDRTQGKSVYYRPVGAMLVACAIPLPS